MKQQNLGKYIYPGLLRKSVEIIIMCDKTRVFVFWDEKSIEVSKKKKKKKKTVLSHIISNILKEIWHAFIIFTLRGQWQSHFKNANNCLVTDLGK